MAIRRVVPAAALLAAALVSVSTVRAQGAFYREVEKDGRIYVFNIQRAFMDWEKSGEMGVAITLLAYGPNGETMVFDSEEAIHLYNFKHNRPGDPRPQPTPSPGATVSWRDGATTLLFPGLAQVRISNRVQLRYTQELPDEAVTLPGTGGAGESRGSFRIRRAKLKIDGWFYKPNLLYELQLNWPAATGANIGAFLEDANINWDLTGGERRFMVKFGQYKVPFGHQELTSSGSQQFVDRSQVSNTYARGRDLGLQLWGRTWGDRVEWRVGAFNGNGLTRTTNDNDTFQWNARVMLQPNGQVPLGQGLGNSGPLFSEGDFESTDKPIWAVAVNYERNDFHRTTSNIDLRDDVWGFDGLFKFKGVFLTAEYYLREREPEPPASGGTAASFDSDGWFVQGGYAFGARRQWELAGRYGSFDPTSLTAGNDQREWRVGGSYYYQRHALKVQADYGQLENKGNGQKNGEFRVQTQFLF
ncbi:MAG TPA: porin [Vicinamibacteria bacterium]|nr:porin [Vicinamibacteria bacterium]